MPALPKDRSPLLPDRHPTPDFFVCDIFGAAPKGDMASMEHPIFSLSTRPDRHVRRYEHGECFVEIKPSADGVATVHDRDILIYCISQIMAALERLAGTRINTNIITGGQEIFNIFGLIDRFEIVRETRDGRMQEVEVKSFPTGCSTP